MSVIKRFTNLVRANANAVLEKLEDPETMLRDSIERMERDFARCRERVGQLMAESKLAFKRVAYHKARAEEWLEKARIAVRMGKEDLAKEALSRRETETRRADEFQSILAEQETLADEAKAALVELKDRIEKARGEMSGWIARQRNAKVRLHRSRQSASGKEPSVCSRASVVRSDAIEEFERIARRIEELECQADAQDELAHEVSLPHLGKESVGATCANKPHAFSAEVELELQRLKDEAVKG
jgi:phage shock protein A